MKALDLDQPKMLDPDPDEMNADPQLCFFHGFFQGLLQFARCLSSTPSLLGPQFLSTPEEALQVNFLNDGLIDR
jgi:hypothetical protein